MLLVVHFIHGPTFGITSTALAAVLMDIIPKERCGEGVGYFSLSAILATSIGPFLGLYISQHGDYSIIFIVCTVLSFIGMFLSLPLKVSPVKTAPRVKSILINPSSTASIKQALI